MTTIPQKTLMIASAGMIGLFAVFVAATPTQRPIERHTAEITASQQPVVPAKEPVTYDRDICPDVPSDTMDRHDHLACVLNGGQRYVSPQNSWHR